MDETGMEWSDPPKIKYDWDEIASRLKAEPGRWLKVFDFDRISVANAVRQGSIKAIHPKDGFEVRTSSNDVAGRTCTLYLRWNPHISSGLTAAIIASRKQD